MKIEYNSKIDQYHHFDFQPGNGTRYDIVVINDPYGGLLVVWPNVSTYRYFGGSNPEIKHLHGKKNKFDQKAIKDFLNGVFI